MANTTVLDAVKLVIWDLDDTFWDGTLSEGGARFSQDMLALVRDLAAHGIVSSIASNNDMATARAHLSRHDAWEWFVFPQIGWGAKSQMVRRIIDDAQLRPENTVFLDDKARIRESVTDAIPALLTTTTASDFAATWNAWAEGRAAADPERTRLGHYQLLERRSSARTEFTASGDGSDQEFLAQSRIVCTIAPATDDMAGRIHELVGRTNQLNFTRVRLSLDEVRQLLCDPNVRTGAVHVSDRFGDYGLCGFFAIQRQPGPLVTHFLFSCRVLNMGIESAVYAALGRPPIECAPEQSAAMARVRADATDVDWVTVCHRDVAPAPGLADDAGSAGQRAARLTLVGPCDVLAIGAGIARSSKDPIRVRYRAMCVNDKGHVIRHFGHRAFLSLASTPALAGRHLPTLSRIPWFDAELLRVSSGAGDSPEVIMLSAVRNAQCAEYRHQSGEFSVPFEYFRIGGADITDPAVRRDATDFTAAFHQGCPAGFMSWFAEQFAYAGLPTRDGFDATLQQLLEGLPSSTRVVVLNLPDVSSAPIALPGHDRLIAEWRRQHAEINAAIDRWHARNASRSAVIDMRTHVVTSDDYQDTQVPPGRWSTVFAAFDRHYHFKRHVFVAVRLELMRLLREWQLVEPRTESSVELLGAPV